MRRSFVAATAAVLLLPATSAWAGGMSTLGFQDEYVTVGETVTGRTRFYTKARGTGRIENGPWHAYLIQAGSWIEPPSIPEGAIDLGPIAIEDQGDGRALASITFTVPDVTTGSYHLGLCNVPCNESYVGDLGGGWLTIARTEEGASLLRSLDRTEGQVHRIRYRLARRITDLERPLDVLESRLDELDGSIELRLDELESRLRQSRAVEREPSGAPWVTSLFAAAVVAAAALLLRRGRRPRPAPVPQEPLVVEWELPEEVSSRT
ncbi:MAG: hypothetical protein ACRDHV_06510 [Actinomycetota bacterium]